MERRAFEIKELRVERVEGRGPKIGGYAAMFNSESVDLGGFTERIAQGAFSTTLAGSGDIMALAQHNPEKPLASRAAGTLAIVEDERGLAFEAGPLPDTTHARDVVADIEAGNIKGMSFAFNVPKGGDRWAKVGPGQWLRTLLDLRLIEVSPVTFPAYPAASVGLRAQDGAAEALAGLARAKAADEARQRRLRLLELEARS